MTEEGEKLQGLPIEERLQNMAQALGFVETDALLEVKDRFLASTDRAEDKKIISEYHAQAIELVNSQPGEKLPQVQVGLNVALAAMYREREYSADYQIGIEDTAYYASQIGDYETANQFLAILLKDEKYHYPSTTR